MPFLFNFYISGRIELGSNWSQAQGKRKRDRERETKNRYLVSIQIMVIIYWVVFITHCFITQKIHNSVFELKTCVEVTISIQSF